MRILYLYKWCTFGGVERVLINRAMAFKQFNIDVSMNVYFFYPGVVESFKTFLKEFNLENYLRVVDKIDINAYDWYVSIDTDEAFEIKGIKNLILEYHTRYEEHGKYIYKAPREKIKYIIVPSQDSKRIAEKKRPDFVGSIFVLRNFVIDYNIEKDKFTLPEWGLRPIVWVGRIDDLKNPYFILEGINEYRKIFKDDVFFCSVGNSLNERKFINFIKRESMINRTVWYPGLRFDKVTTFFKLMGDKKAVFVSASSAESFGMSVAEALFYGLPVLVSDIPAHKDLVRSNSNFLFSLKNKQEFANKLNNIINNYDILSKDAKDASKRFSVNLFLEDWKHFEKKLLNG